MPGDHALQTRAGSQKQAAGGIEPFTFANSGRFGGGVNGDGSAEQRMMPVIFPKQCGERGFGLAHQNAMKMMREREQRRSQIERGLGMTKLLKKDDSIGDVARKRPCGDIDVETYADEVDMIESLAKQTSEFYERRRRGRAAARSPGARVRGVNQVIGPFELNILIGCELGGGVTNRQSCCQRKMMRRERRIDRQDKCDGERAGRGEPGIRTAPTPSRLARGEHDRRRKEIASLAHGGGMETCRAECGEEMEAEGFYAGAEFGEAE